jgi:hypothetical protein
MLSGLRSRVYDTRTAGDPACPELAQPTPGRVVPYHQMTIDRLAIAAEADDRP